MFDLSNRTALVTGAGRGVGAGIARALAAQGALVIVNDYFEDRAHDMATVICDAGGRAESVAFDASDRVTVASRVSDVVNRVGGIDILVANVGTLPNGQGVKHFLDMEPEEWPSHIDNNLYSTLNCIHAVAPAMVRQGWGRLIAIASDAGRVGSVGSSIYGAAKAGVIGLMRSLGKELGPHGVTTNSIALGLIDTVPPEFAKGAASHYAVGRIGTPADVAAACVYLSSEEAGWMSGQCLVLNGASHGG